MPLATLSIDLVAQTAKFEGEMRRAAGVVEAASQRIDKAFGGVGAVFAGNLLASAAIEAIRSLSGLIPGLIESAAKFQDLEEKTGASAEALASFTTAGDVAGVSADQLAGFMVKLTGTLSKTNDETKGAGKALAALGLDLEAFSNLAPEEQFKTLADRLATFKDGAGKTAVAIALLGKSGADALPFLKELAQSGLTQNRLTAEQIKLADDYADRQARVRSELRQAAQIAALQALPAFTALTAEFSKAAKALIGFDEASGKLTDSNGIRDFAQGGAIAIAVLAESLVGLIKLVRAVGGSFEAVAADINAVATIVSKGAVINRGGLFNAENREAIKSALDDRNKIVEEANARYVKLFEESGTKVSDALRLQFSAQGKTLARIQQDPTELARRGRPQIVADKVLNFKGIGDGGGGADKAAREAEQRRKAILDGALKRLESSFASERDAVQFQQRFLEAERQGGLLSLSDFYAERQKLDQRALDLELNLLRQQGEAVRESLKAPTVSEPDRIKGVEQLADIEAKAALARQRFGQQRQLDAQEEARGYQQAGDRVIEFRAQILELQGNLNEAAKLRANLAIAQAQRTSVLDGIKPEEIEAYKAATIAQTAFGAAQRNVQQLTQSAGIEEQRFLLAARNSAASRTEIEQGLFAIRSRALVQMGEELAKVEAIAKAADPNSPAVQFARQLRLEFEQLSVAVDPALERLRAVGDEVADALGRAAGAITINFRDARSALKSLGNELQQILTRELVTQPLTDFFRKEIRGLINGDGGLAGIAGGIFGTAGKKPEQSSGLSLAGLFGGNPATTVPGFAGGEIDLTKVGADLFGLGRSASDSAAPALGNLAEAATLAAIALRGIGGQGGVPGGGGFLTELAGGAGSSGALDFIGNSFIKLFGLESGGYTGNAPTNAAVGVVHGGEYVMSAPAVRALGVPALEQLHQSARGGAPRLILPGYANGGFVGRGQRGGGSAVNQSLTFNIAGPVDRSTMEQIAAKTARAARSAVARGTA